ncbi:winged helix-turn-helix domain-containing protein [Pseudobacteriovorax antillogorgiicola]|nr:crosslink repair DNA glycosylase YcaQ family protein [Pseudobacteriovorax antillogorgiicola]
MIFSCQKLDSDSKDTKAIIEHLGYVQLDTISVLEKAHHHVLWARNSNYRPVELDQLVEQRVVFEYWSHAASILPMRDYRYSLYLKRQFRETSNWNRDKKMMKLVLKRIRDEGPLQSSDFKRELKKTSSGWWDWKPAKKALERLFLDGDLEVTRREAFRKVYDLPENVIPGEIDQSFPTEEEYYQYLINRTIRHQGFATAKGIAYLNKSKVRDGVKKVAEDLTMDGQLTRINIKGLSEDYFTFPEHLELKTSTKSKVHILSPFDNMVIQRSRLQEIFNYSYQLECYVPEAKRKFGYFCLPIFKGTKAIGRIDCKADRSSQTLIVNSLHSESSADISKQISPRLKEFARFNGCKDTLW